MSKCWVVDDRLLSFELFLPPVELVIVPVGDPGGTMAERNAVAAATGAFFAGEMLLLVPVAVVVAVVVALLVFVFAAIVIAVVPVRVAAVLVGERERERDLPSGLRERDFFVSRLLGKTA